MTQKISLLAILMLLNSRLLNAQNTDRGHFKRRYAISSNFGMVIPTSSFSEKNRLGTNSGAVLEADFKRYLFARFTWDMVQFRYIIQNDIGDKLVDISSNNRANIFFLSLGYYTDIKKWRFYPFGGIGFANLDNPRLTTEIIGNANYSYLSNQNTGSLVANYGLGAGYKVSANERIMIEGCFTQMPDIVDNATYLSLQLVYKVFFTESK